jgi:hypothetical protein
MRPRGRIVMSVSMGRVRGALLRARLLTMVAEEQAKLTMIARIERPRVLLAHFIELDGDVHVAMYEKFELRGGT